MKTNRHAAHILFLVLCMVLVWTAAEVQGTRMAAPLPAQQNSQQAQIEKGRSTVAQVCVGCHAGIMRMLEAQKKSQEEWRDTVHSMIGRGAQVLPDEIDPLVAYLVTSNGSGPQQATAATTNQGQPGAEASAILARRCQLCHDVDTATTRPASEDWDAVLDRMTTLGASVTPAERQILIEHLNGLDR